VMAPTDHQVTSWGGLEDSHMRTVSTLITEHSVLAVLVECHEYPRFRT
jgi:hypothetical protein